MGDLNKDACDKYNTKFFKIPNNGINWLSYYLELKFECGVRSKALQALTSTGATYFIYDLIHEYESEHDVYKSHVSKSSYYPLFVNIKGLINDSKVVQSTWRKNTTFDHDPNSCDLCDLMHKTGFSTDPNNIIERYALGDYNPGLDETYLIYKNFYIVFNAVPYLKNHLMLISSNHEPNKIKGSQYELLNREVLEDIIRFYLPISRDYIGGHNYSFTGSQSHFHLHLIKANSNGFDIFIYDLSKFIEEQLLTYDNGKGEDKVDRIGGFGNEFEYKYWSKLENSKTCIVEFKLKEYGYSGYLLTASKESLKDEKELNTFINILYKFLNSIENSILNTFTLHFSPAVDMLNIVILPQKRSDATSFRNITGFVFSDKEMKNDTKDSYDDLVKQHKISIERHIIKNLFTDEEIFKILEPELVVESNIYGDTSMRQIFTLDNKSYLGKYTNDIMKQIKNKPVSDYRKVIIINSPIGSGKSLLYKNLNKYFEDYDENKFVHINIDDIVAKIPFYNKELNKISTYLKDKYLDKKFETYTNVNLHRFGGLSIKSLKDYNIMLTLDIPTYKHLYDEIFNTIHPDFNKDHTIKEYNDELFRTISVARSKLYSHLISLCVKFKVNFVIENARVKWDALKSDLSKIPHRSYLGYLFENDDTSKKFLLKNVLLRNILEGRILNYDEVISNLEDNKTISESYRKYIIKNSFILIPMGFKIPVKNYSKTVLENINFSAFERFDTDFPKIVCQKINDIDEITDKGAGDLAKNDNGSFIIKCIEYMKKDIENIKNTQYLLKKQMTDFNNRYLLDENTTSIILYNTITHINSIINLVINHYNTNLKDPRALALDINDIKLVLKGGISVRLHVKSIFNYFEKNLNLNDENDESQKELKKFIQELDSDSSSDNVFKNTSGKSDLDFVILMNKIKFNNNSYIKVKKLLVTLISDYLFDLKDIFSKTSYFGKFNNYFKKIEEKLQPNNIYRSGYLSQMILGDNDLHFESEVPKTDKRNKILVYPLNNFFNLDTSKSNDVFIGEKIEVDPRVNKSGDEKDFDKYLFITYNKTLQIPKYSNTGVLEYKNIELLRLKNRFSKGHGLDTEATFSGEIIDIVFEDFYSSSPFNLDDLFTINYANNLFNFNITTYTIDYLIKELEKVIFVDNFYPWISYKYEKQLSRYFLLLIIKSIIDAASGKPITNDFTTDLLPLMKITSKSDLPPTHLFYSFIKSLNFLKNKINLIKANFAEYNRIIDEYGFEVKVSAFDHYQNMNKKYDELCQSITKCLSSSKNIFDLIMKFTNKKILEDINTINTIKKYNIVQWGGYKYLYNNFKNHYINLKGGALSFSGSFYTDFKIVGLPSSKSYNSDQKRYLELFTSKVLPNVKIDGIPFTSSDISGIQPLGCGSFGCGVKICHSGTGDEFLLKIIGDTYDYRSYVRYLPDYLKETYIGYYLQNMPHVFNRTLAYFKTSNIPNDIYFSSAFNDITYDGSINNTNYDTRIANIFIVMQNAGTDSLENLFSYLKTNELTNELITRNIADNKAEEYLKCVSKIIIELLTIGLVHECSKISKDCIYITHNDIKPANIIFKAFPEDIPGYQLKNAYSAKFIDFGGCQFSKNFFTPMSVHTPLFFDYVIGITKKPRYNPRKVSSPLYDIGSVIYSIIYMLKDNNDLINLLEDLKIKYIDENIPDINIQYNLIKEDLIKRINRILFDNIIADPKNCNAIRKLVGELISFINLAMCINKFYFMYDIELKNDRHLDKIELKESSFSFLVLVNEKEIPKAKYFVHLLDSNEKLLKKIMRDTFIQAENYYY